MHSEKNQQQLMLRCLLERNGDIYLAYCIDLCLGVQGDSPQEVRDKLHAQIDDYLQTVAEVYNEGDVASAKQLLNRKAPLSIQARYHFVRFKNWWRQKCAQPTWQLWKEEPPTPFAFQ